jgi:hypothetical protein
MGAVFIAGPQVLLERRHLVEEGLCDLILGPSPSYIRKTGER